MKDIALWQVDDLFEVSGAHGFQANVAISIGRQAVLNGFGKELVDPCEVTIDNLLLRLVVVFCKQPIGKV